MVPRTGDSAVAKSGPAQATFLFYPWQKEGPYPYANTNIAEQR